MLLHIVEDEVFINSVIVELDKLFPGENIYLVNTPVNKHELKHIKSKNAICAPFMSEKYQMALNKYENSDAVIFHNLIKRYKWNILKHIPQKTKKVWIAWGADIYGSGKLAESFYRPLTQKHARRIRKTNSTLKGPLRDILFNLGSLAPLNWRISLGINDNIQNYFKYIDYISPVIYEDYELLKKLYPKTKFKYLPFRYNVANSLFSNINQPITSGKNIIIGNSASPVNNHLDAFELLKNIKLGNDQKIIVPLSYGGDKVYIASILKKGQDYFNDHFYPISDFLPKEEYNHILQSVGFGFFNSLRQLAMGNIYTLLFMGAKIFIDEKNPTFNFLKRNKLNFCSLNQNIIEIQNEMTRPMHEDEIIKNRLFLFNEFETTNYQKKLEQFINELREAN